MLGGYFKIYTKNTTATSSLLKFHKIIGYVMFIAGLRNIYLGWDINKDGDTSMLIIIYIPLPLLFIGLEVYHKLFLSRASVPNQKLREMTHFEVMEQVNSGKKLMFADELVIDVTAFVKAHPGGSFLISKNLGEDVGKYMVGCSSYGSKYNPYEHSINSFAIVKKLAVARIAHIDGYLTPINNNERVTMKFLVKNKKRLNTHTRALTLTSSEYKVSNKCKDTTWIGKHFMFIFMKRMKAVRRYYSALFVDLENWGTDQKELQNEESVMGELKFVFKVYPGGKMTNYVDGLKQGDTIMIRGPLGPGLLLSSLNGSFLVLAGGTGLVPFIDLVDMAYKQYGKSTDEFKLALYVFFRTYKDGFALDNLKEFADNTDWLILEVVTDEHPNKKGIPDEIKLKVAQPIDLAWVCGPSGFNRSYSKLLIKEGVPKEKVIVM
jgi:NAD(P)H-flavin reductase